MFFSINDHIIINMDKVKIIDKNDMFEGINITFKDEKIKSYPIKDANFKEFIDRLNEWQKQFIK